MFVIVQGLYSFQDKVRNLTKLKTLYLYIDTNFLTLTLLSNLNKSKISKSY